MKVCPVCLEETEAYDRLYWRTRFLITCPRHAVFLRERCPACHAAIPSLRSSPTWCPTCGKGDYRAAPHSLQPSLPKASCLLAGDLLTLKALGVDGEAANGPPAMWQGEGLASLSPPQYFSLLHSFCKVVEIFSADSRSYRLGIPECRSPSHTGSLTPGPTTSLLCLTLFSSGPYTSPSDLPSRITFPESSSGERAMTPTTSWIRHMGITSQPLTDRGTLRW
jgi:hypothetical protein